MKRFISILLVCILSLSLVACNTSNDTTNTPPAEETPSEITLTTSNITEYLNISGQYGKIERETTLGISFGSSDFTINVDPSVPGSFYNVSVTLKVDLTYGWDVSSSDPAYSENDGYLTTTIKLPAHGSKEETHSLIAAMGYGNHNNQNVKIRVVSVSGTFVPAN